MISHLEQVEQYDTVYLVYPIWHYTLSVPTAAFLDEYDFSGKTIYAFAANAGSRFADSIEKIQAAEPEATVIEGISVSQREMDGAKDAVSAKIQELMEEVPSMGETSEKEQTAMKMNVQVGTYTFTATLEGKTVTTAGDIVLYNGNNIVMFYGSNSWSYTRIGKIDDLTDWTAALGSGDITAIFTLAE